MGVKDVTENRQMLPKYRMAQGGAQGPVKDRARDRAVW